MSEYIQVLTAIDSKEGAQTIAEAVLSKRLAACAQVIGPITSTYWWQNKMETAEEWLCLMKTDQQLYSELEQAIREVHPYDVAEIVAMPIVAGSSAYLAWIHQEVKGS
jgi:periplasmic divalent cation tolerance protein